MSRMNHASSTNPAIDGRQPSRRARRRLQPAHEVRARRRRLVGWSVFGVSSLLMINALVGENGYLATVRADHEYAELEAALNTVRQENQQLRHEIVRMRDDPTALEEVARREQGLISPGETVVIVKEPAPAGGRRPQ